MKGTTKILSGLLVTVLSFHAVHAGVITLSGYSTDETPAEILDATVGFSLTGDTLTIVVTNLTDGPDGGSDDGFDITEIFFNAADNILDLTWSGPDEGWVLHSFGNSTKAGGLGQFDYAVIGGIGSSPVIVEGESSHTFSFSVTHDGSGAIESDFYSELSSVSPGENPMLVAAKFQRGPGDDSAYGGTNTPEPATLAILGLGSMFLLFKRKK